MGFYSHKILPYLLDLSLSDPILANSRQEILAQVKGEILEIGFGTGLNLPYYPKHVHKIVAIDANSGTRKLAQKLPNHQTLQVISTKG